MYSVVCVHSQSQRPLTRTMPRSRQRMRLCLAGMVCLPVGGGLPTQAFLGVAARPPRGAITSGRDTAAAGATRLKAAGGTATAAAAVSGTLKRSLRRPRASTALMSRAVFPSVSRTPLFPGGIYEGEKKERGGAEEADYNRNVGKVVDTLRRDYPRMFDEPLDFDIYTPELQMRDPTGVVVTGLPAYQRLFATFRFFRQVLVSEVSTTIRISYDGSRQQVRVTWHFIFDATRVIARPMHVDGISVYSLNAKGLVRRHDLETIIVNGTPAKPPFAQAWLHPPSWITKGLNGGVAAPGLSSYSSGSIGGGVGGVGGVGVGVDAASFRSGDGGREGEAAAVLTPLGFFPTGWSSFLSALDSAAIVAGMVAATRVRMPPPPSTGFGFDEGVLWAFSEGVGAGEGESSEEDLEGYLPRENGGGEVETGEAGEGGEARDSGGKKAPAKDTLTKKKKKKKKGFWPIEYDGPLGCETSWDCTGGYVCCDLLVVRICCSNGVMQRKPGDLIPVLTPIPGRGKTELDQFEPMPTR